MRAYIVTGTTRGIGRAIAETVVSAKDQLLSLSSAVDKIEPYWINLECDFRQCSGISGKLRCLLEASSLNRYNELILVNNAGVLDPMGPLDEASETQILSHLAVNQAAPLIFTSAFIRLTNKFNIQRRIINISSGAARHPYSGWVMYCASKAAMDMATLSIAAEQRYCDNPVTVSSVSPGRVETGMQRKIRQFDKTKFPAQPDFVNAKMRGDLITPRQAALLIIGLDSAGELKNGGLYDLRSATIEGQCYSIKPMNNTRV